MTEIDTDTILAATEVVRLRQSHPEPTTYQKNVIENLVRQKNTVNQIPTGSGKTWPVISLPLILDVLSDNFKQDVPNDTRVLYIVPLVNIYHSLSREMSKLGIPHQILSSGSDVTVDVHAKVVCASPEKLLDKNLMSSIIKLSWSAVSIDEPHLGMSALNQFTIYIYQNRNLLHLNT